MSAFIKSFHFTGILLILVSLVSFASYAGDYLNTEELSEQFSKITVHGEDEGVNWKETYLPGGKIVGKYGAEPYRGKWKIVNGMMCLDYAGAEEDGCWFVKLNKNKNNVIQWFSEDGTADGEERFEITQ